MAGLVLLFYHMFFLRQPGHYFQKKSMFAQPAFQGCLLISIGTVLILVSNYI